MTCDYCDEGNVAVDGWHDFGLGLGGGLVPCAVNPPEGRCPTCGSDDPESWISPEMAERMRGATMVLTPCPDPFHRTTNREEGSAPG